MRLPALLLALLCFAPLTATAQEPTVEAMQDYMMFSEYEAGIILPQQIDQQVFETALFIDTRSADQFAANHIPGAVNIEWRQVLEQIDEIPSDRMTILYCNTVGPGHLCPACGGAQQCRCAAIGDHRLDGNGGLQALIAPQIIQA